MKTISPAELKKLQRSGAKIREKKPPVDTTKMLATRLDMAVAAIRDVTDAMAVVGEAVANRPIVIKQPPRKPKKWVFHVKRNSQKLITTITATEQGA